VVRDDAWLAARVAILWDVHFSDVPRGLPIVTRFGSRARYRFGSIAARKGSTVILINRLFAEPEVPDYVIDATLAHELAHYAHGFGSGLPKVYQHAHRGGVVDRELEQRGLGEVMALAEAWRKQNWEAFYNSQTTDIGTRRAERGELKDLRWDRILCAPGARSDDDLQQRYLQILRAFQLKEIPFEVRWLRASRRQLGLSYWFREGRSVGVHGLLADRRVPTVVVDFELAYWVARSRAGKNWAGVLKELERAGLRHAAEDAMRWRQHAWTQFRRRNHPLEP
jgi:hypothetical protein